MATMKVVMTEAFASTRQVDELIPALQKTLNENNKHFDADFLREFTAAYLRHVELSSSRTEQLIGLISNHLSLGSERTAPEVLISSIEPHAIRDGWSAGGASVVFAILDDQRYVIDTMTITLAQQGWSLNDLIHPQLSVSRDESGKLTRGGSSGGETSESWVAMLVKPPLGKSYSETADKLEIALQVALEQLDDVADDTDIMREQIGHTKAVLRGPEAEIVAAHEFLDWLMDDNFVFLGYCEYSIRGTGRDAVFTKNPNAGLGLQRLEDEGQARFDAYALSDKPALMVVTKDSVRSRIHRAAYRDYIGFRILNSAGQAIGEHRYLGLFTADLETMPVDEIPYLRTKAYQIEKMIGYQPDSFGGLTVRQILDDYPRDELFQATAVQLAPYVQRIAGVAARDEVLVFLRKGEWQRFVTALVLLPPARFEADTPALVANLIKQAVGGESVGYRSTANDETWVSVYVVVQMSPGRTIFELQAGALETAIDQATRTWEDQFIALAADLPTEQRGIEFEPSYQNDYSPAEALADLRQLNQLQSPDDLRVYIKLDDQRPRLARLKMYRIDSPLTLSDVMPHLTAMGVKVIDEVPAKFELRGVDAYLYDFGLELPAGCEFWSERNADLFTDAVVASYQRRIEADQLNQLVTEAGLSWRQTGLLRALSRYLQQVGIAYSQSYISQSILRNQGLAVDLLTLFKLKFDPELVLDESAITRLQESIETKLEAVPSLDDDRILRLIYQVVQALVRTNFYTSQHQNGAEALALKLLPKRLAMLPEPRPEYEIFVYSARVEGVHLRFGKVARGGLRWSDRAEDYRTEVLGLVKAQMVKNTVIVPVGSKGGFYPKTITSSFSREERAAEGLASYRIFISALLSVTDNIVASEVVAPVGVRPLDDQDPYLVVAADKGTAAFSDEANAIALGRGFWLGDAFASGGSNGYDHKEMGITARGAWESVKRHFAELGVDCQTQDFTCVGVGDMAGDVFGNGMLLSKHIRLVAAFNHQHIFLDPNPDAASSWEERRRLFELPRSSWADYDRSVISSGGGVFERSLKSVELSQEARLTLGIAAERLSPGELIHAILQAPVDLLYNGGIGTYVKATTETHDQVGDRANDSLRVNGNEVRARVTAEGGNLGWTQLGRIEYALTGGRLNTDFIDNSGGVDSSDREVNIKILLDSQLSAGNLTTDSRNALLHSMTDEVVDLVLASNVSQNQALAKEMLVAGERTARYEALMVELEDAGYLNRSVEFLPSSVQMSDRIATGQTMSCPELAVLLSYVKIQLEDEILRSSLPDDPGFAQLLVEYFPTPLRERFATQMAAHRLAREIITTQVVNRFVDSHGILAVHELARNSGKSFAEVILENW